MGPMETSQEEMPREGWRSSHLIPVRSSSLTLALILTPRRYAHANRWTIGQAGGHHTGREVRWIFELSIWFLTTLSFT